MGVELDMEKAVEEGPYREEYSVIKDYATTILGGIHHSCANDYLDNHNILVFTDHGKKHTERIIFYLNRFLTELSPVVKLEAKEQFVLMSAAWLHDVGMFIRNPEFTDAKIQRKYHGRVARSVIREILDKYKYNVELMTAIAEVSELHQSRIKTILIDDNSLVSNEKRNALGSMLLLADAIDICVQRVNTKEAIFIKKFYNKFNFSSVAEWWINEQISKMPEILVKDNKLIIKYTISRETTNAKSDRIVPIVKYINMFLVQYIRFEHFKVMRERNFLYFTDIEIDIAFEDQTIPPPKVEIPPEKPRYKEIKKIWVDHLIDYKIDSISKQLESIKNDINAHDVYLFVYDNVRDVIRYLVIPDYLSINDNIRNNPDDKKILKALYDCRIPPKWGIIGHVYYCALNEIVESVEEDPRTHHDESDKEINLSCVMFYPLIDNDDFLWAVLMVNKFIPKKNGKDYFNQNDIVKLEKAVEQTITTHGATSTTRKQEIINAISKYASPYTN